MRPSIVLSIGAAFLTPAAIILMNLAFGASPGAFNSPALRISYIVSAFLLALAVALWKPISPIVYGVALVVVFGSMPFVIAGLSGSSLGNLGGLIVILSLGLGLVVGLPVAAAGYLLRRFALPRWISGALAVLAVVVSATAHMTSRLTASAQSDQIIDSLRQIRNAELTYAGTHGGAFTCSGPDLPGLRDIDWQSNTALGRLEKSQALVQGHWIYLQCDSAVHPTRFQIRAVPTSGGDELDLDSDGQISTKPMRR